MGWQTSDDHDLGVLVPEEVDAQAVARVAACALAEVEFEELLLGTARRVVHVVGVALVPGTHRVYRASAFQSVFSQFLPESRIVLKAHAHVAVLEGKQ